MPPPGLQVTSGDQQGPARGDGEAVMARTRRLILLGFAIALAAPGTPLVFAATERAAAVPLVYVHTQACPVPPADAILVACVCDHDGKNCRPVVEEDRAPRAKPSPWCQCAAREIRIGR
jgi:hypothetical protein